MHALGPSRSNYGYTDKLVPWLRRHSASYDAIFVEGLWQYHSLGTWRALHRENQPYYVFPHGMLDPWFRQRYPIKHLKKMAYWLAAEYRVLRDARAVLFTAEEEKTRAAQTFRPYRCRAQVVTLGTTPPAGDAAAQRETFLNAFPQLRGQRCLLFLGRLHTKKGCDLLVRAFESFAETHGGLRLVMAGPDPDRLRPNLEALISRRVAERIVWTGMLQGDLKWGAFHAADAFVLPSHQENFGVAIAEALACSLPVLISRRINIWREIDADRAGFTAEDTLAGTRKMIGAWLALSMDERRAMRKRAHDCFVARFEATRAARFLLEAIQTAPENTD